MAYEWKQITQTGDQPTARSGHSFNWVGAQNYLLYGGIEERKDGKVIPDPEVYMLKMMQEKCTWYKEATNSTDKPLARSQHVAQTTPKGDRLFVFGGHHTQNTRLNDTWIFQIKEMEWRRIGGKPAMNNQESDIGAPCPRANMGSCVFNGKVIIFGGHGGINFERKNFNDMYMFDFESEAWSKITAVNAGPEGRGGCSVFARPEETGDKVFVYGGWNAEKQFNEIWSLDLNKMEWTDCDIFNGVPRWNHSSLLIEAIPTWKFFIFGGECAEYNEGADRSFGEYVNSSCFIDLGMMQWVTYASDPDAMEAMPSPREYTAMTYDQREQRLLLFGGWNNGWKGDLWALKVGKIVGPSYAIMSSDPSLGQLSGGVPIHITGQGFKEVNINVLFTMGSKPVDTVSKQTLVQQGTYISPNEISCLTPSFEVFGPKECVIQLQIGNEEISTTWVNFNYFLNTRAIKSLAYGPGCMAQEVSSGNEVEFTIQARNDLGENRTSGRDVFEVNVCQYKESEEDGKRGEKIEIESKIEDMDNGKYIIRYTAQEETDVHINVDFLNDKGVMVPLRGSPYKAKMKPGFKATDGVMIGEALKKYISTEIKRLQELMQMTKNEINTKDKDKDMSNVKQLLKVKENVENTQEQQEQINLQIDQLDESIKLMLEAKKIKEVDQKSFMGINKTWQDVKKMAKDVKKEIQPLVDHEKENNNKNIKTLEEEITFFTQEMRKREFFQYKCGVKIAIEKLGGVFDELKVFEDKIDDYGDNARKFLQPDMINKAIKDIEGIKITIKAMNELWQHIEFCDKSFDTFLGTKWNDTDPGDMEDQVKKLMKTLKDMKVDKRANAYNGILDEIKKWLNFLPLIGELRDISMRERHWDSIREKVGSNFTIDSNLYLKNIYDLNLGKYKEDVEEITDQSRQEAKMEKTLGILQERWVDILFEFREHKGTGMQMIGLDGDNFDLLENDQVSVTAMTSSRYLATFEDKINYWQKSLAAINEVVVTCGEVQRTWSFLESLFIHSEEVKKELPNESVKFIGIDKDVKTVLTDAYATQKALDFSIKEYVLPKLEELQKELTLCEKALNEFMESKRLAFPRFFFVSPADLLDILSMGNNPAKIMCHMPKIISAMETLELLEEGVRPFAKGMHACVGKEYVEFTRELKLMGKVEVYLQDVLDTMTGSLKDISMKSLKKFGEIDKESWLIQDPAMVTLLINNCQWVILCEQSFLNVQGGDKNAVSKAFDKQVADLQGLIMMVQGDLTKPVRQKIMCMITMDAHSRDIIDELVREGVAKSDEFQWQRQLKGLYDSGQKDFVFKIADACLNYGYEYLGNGARLVITPLTDRIYVTATQALHLKMGCAPAGPAGTGKTESTKDLASALGKACYVFNCSDQMDYQTMAGIFKGLAASGSWGCFDEFNRLVPAVLSVCSVQFKAVCDAILAGVSRFNLQGDEVNLDPTCGAFITMNPGYLGRSELPEGLKALFRPITVVVPDLELICENMLMAEGFTQAKPLAKKFTTLYFLCRDLLSKAAHYDWGLRAIKSVLNVAGAMKRDEPQLPESAILLRALRDFNLPKIVADDLGIFYGLLGDLFPGIDVPRKRDMKLEGIITQCVLEAGLYEEPEFILKVVQLSELLAVRHCVFTMGPPGAGKSSTWQMLGKAQTKDGRKTTIIDLNPKVTSTNELYGVILLATREWKDGLLSNKMRFLASQPDTDPKWLILDGDLDANWIESMNSVMDDNKLLTLASNERISVKPHMRLIFEIRDLRFATPATVSRAGILYISDDDGYQWRAYVKSWLGRIKTSEQNLQELPLLFEKYVPDTLFHCAKAFKHIIPQVQIAMVISICKLIENIVNHNEVKSIEWIFVFACIWCIGGGFGEKDGKDYRQLFDKWWKSEKGKIIKFPGKGTVFEYFIDIENTKLEDWSKMATGDVVASIDTSKSIQSYTVPTADTISAQYIMKQLIQINHSPMLSGLAGFGKTQIIKGLLNELCFKQDSEYIQQIVNMNFYTTANLLQLILEQQLEKKAGRLFAPPGAKKLLYFVDDLNMPGPDPYDTQTAIALLRQHRDYEHWYDKNKLTLKDIKNTQLIASMNPTAGTFIINPRLQRHFWLLSVGMPDQSSLSTIYLAYLQKHFQSFKVTISELINGVVKSTLSLFGDVQLKFRKTAQNFHYEFNVRHLTNVFQGLLQARQEAIKEPDNLIRLWVHECDRIFGDRLVDAKDLSVFRGLLAEVTSKSFSKFNLKKYFGATPEPLIFAQFVGSLDDKLYDQFPSAEAMSARLHEGLREYNDVNAVMDLVLFEDAMKHVCKICRIIASDQGHALLVGVGGSGKQSLTRLSSFMCQYATVGIMISSTYGMGDLKTDLQNFYMKSGGKDEGLCFLFTEGQITKEEFLVYINDLLSSGEIADLFQAEDMDGIVNQVRGPCKSEGLGDTPAACWKFFIDRVKKNLHMSLCFSPVGDAFRNRAKKFPALVNCSVIDWFHAWPDAALHSVADKFLAEVEMASDEIRAGITSFMPFSFKTVNNFSQKILDQERRYVYTTPKSFLELIKLFKVMYASKEGQLAKSLDTYDSGVLKLTETGEVVAKLEEDLKIMSVEVEAKKKSADEQATIVGGEKAKVEVENEKAETEAIACTKIKTEVEVLVKNAQESLDKAEPLVIKAEAALAGLDINDFRNLKALKKPPEAINETFTCVLHLLCTIHKDIPHKNGKLAAPDTWKVALSLMGNPQAFLDELMAFKPKVDDDKVPAKNFAAIKDTLAKEDFTVEIITKKSGAAGGLCDWILNISAYYDVVVSVEPLRNAVREGNEKLAAANTKKAEVDALVAKLNAELQVLLDSFNAAMKEKNDAIAAAEKCERKMSLATRLVSALGSEQDRWAQSIIDIGELLKVIIGDVLLASAFVSYVGPFNK